jgi:hypothetical protein
MGGCLPDTAADRCELCWNMPCKRLSPKRIRVIDASTEKLSDKV